MGTFRRDDMTSRVIRPGDPGAVDNEWLDKTVEERIEGVWTLTRILMAWNNGGNHEPRLQRSVSRVHRSWR